MKSKFKLPILVVLASLLLAACLPVRENTSRAISDDGYAAEDAYYTTQAAKETETASIHAYTTPNLRIETVAEDVIPDFQVFSQYIEVFGLHVFASADIPPEKVIHAAGVMAQYLDNDEDGEADDPEVIQALQAKDATFSFSPVPTAVTRQTSSTASNIYSIKTYSPFNRSAVKKSFPTVRHRANLMRRWKRYSISSRIRVTQLPIPIFLAKNQVLPLRMRWTQRAAAILKTYPDRTPPRLGSPTTTRPATTPV